MNPGSSAPAERDRYDLIFVYPFFRVVNYLLNIVKELGSEMRIGIFDVYHPDLGTPAASQAQKTRLEKTDQAYLELCRQAGADILDPARWYDCRLLLMPQDIVQGPELDRIQRDEAVAVEKFGYVLDGIPQLESLGIRKFWCFDRPLFTGMMERAGGGDHLRRLEISEMGTPYRQYPAFDFSALEIDYLIALPTTMLLKEPGKRAALFGNMLALIGSLPRGSRVFLKPHNVKDSGYGLVAGQRIQNLPTPVKGVLHAGMSILDRVAGPLKRRAGYARLLEAHDILCSALLEERVHLLSEVTPHWNFGIEHFLPFVRKGMITGITTCLWDALQQRVPVYNCDSQPYTEGMIGHSLHSNYYVPPCHGKLTFDPALFDRVSETSRQATIIDLIRAELRSGVPESRSP